jgi:hypothetical protein
MSDYGSFITSPLWERTDPEAIRYLRDHDWTEVRGDKGSIAFAGVLRDLSVAGLHDQVRGIVSDLAAVMPIGSDTKITLLEWAGDNEDAPEFSVSKSRADSADAKLAWEKRQLEASAMHERAMRDERENEGNANPDLDAYLA